MATGARRIGAVGVLVGAALVVLMPAAGWAQELQEIDLEGWKVRQPGHNASTVAADAVLLRQYSPVRCEDVGLEAAEVRFRTEWLTPLSHVDAGIKLHVVYDDQVDETVTGAIPRGTRHHEVVCKPRWAAGRRIRTLEVSHGQTGVQLKVTAVKLAVRRTAVSMASSVLGGARLHSGDDFANDILIARASAPKEKRPHLSGVRAPEIRLVASISSGASWVLEKGVQVSMQALDAGGKSLKVFPIHVDGTVRSITVPLEGFDLEKMESFVFHAGGTGVNLAVRQITIGAGTSGLTLKEVNDRFQALLGESRKGKSIPESALAQLAGLLDLYRALE